jgi:GTP1/Obg family GTP-binding protein
VKQAWQRVKLAALQDIETPKTFIIFGVATSTKSTFIQLLTLAT